MEQPLSGLIVIEVATGVSGPYAGKLLADYGADVIKVEPPGGDESRREGTRPGARPEPERSPLFLHVNRNKRSVELADSEAMFVRDLIGGADLVLESEGSGGLDRFGLEAEELRAGRQALVVTSVTPFGHSGPYAGRRAGELSMYAMAGPLNATGMPDREPLKLAGNIVQYQCGSLAATASLAALTMAEQSGHGAHVDVAGFEVQAASIDRRMSLLVNYLFTGRLAEREGGHKVGRFPVGVYPTADGYCQIVFAPNWTDRVVAMLEHEELAERVAAPDWLDDEDIPELMNEAIFGWTLTRTKQQAMEDAQARGLAVTPVNSTTDVLADRHFRQRGFWTEVDHPEVGRFEAPGPQFRMEEGWSQRRPAPLLGQHTAEVRASPPPGRQSSPHTSSTPSALPLDGVRVLDLTVVWAGPLCTTLLGDLGAEVIRLDNPNLFPTATRGAIPRPRDGHEQEFGQHWGVYPNNEGGERPWNRVGPFVVHARNKLGATLDLRTPLGRETFLRLVDESDVFVENNSAKVLEALDLGWEVLRQRNPEMIAVRMPSLGLHGPYTDYVGFGAHMEALCGLSSLRGYEDLDATALDATYFMDPASGVTAAFAVMAALRRRERTGVGELVEFAQAENLLNYIGEYLVDASLTGTAHDRYTNRHHHRAPQGVYPSAGDDRWVTLSIEDDHAWRRLVDLMDGPAWALLPELATEDGRRANHDMIDEGLAAWTSSRDRDELAMAGRSVGLDLAPVFDEADLLGNEQLSARGFFQENGSADVPPTQMPGHLWRWDGPELAWGPLNRMGGDNDQIFRGLLGLTDEEISALEAERHLSLDYLDADGRRL